jgi:hypothetical protein
MKSKFVSNRCASYLGPAPSNGPARVATRPATRRRDAPRAPPPRAGHRRTARADGDAAGVVRDGMPRALRRNRRPDA